jgi:serine/threonine protein kinase
MVQVFARKILRVIGQVSTADLENERKNIAALIENGGNKNIITIINHGWMRELDYYFIDMELCELTLHDYVKYLAGSNELPFDIDASMSPVFIEKESSPFVRMHNTWTIGSHMASGLEFMHKHHQVHRDLKPHNGKTAISRT